LYEDITIFADECGIQEDLVREFGRIQDDCNKLTPVRQKPKAQKLYGFTTGIKHNKTGVISGYTKMPDEKKYKYIAPWIYTDTCDTLLFNTWLKEILIPEVKLIQITYPYKRINLVLDNVAYHKSQQTREILTSNNINLVFQPPYSPDLNPIEPSWDTLKNNIRSKSYNKELFRDKLCESLVGRSWSCDD
jgi:transposase